MENKKYYLYANRQRVEVTKEVYVAYYKAVEQEKYQKRKMKIHGVMSYNNLDTGEQIGEETIVDVETPPIIDQIIYKNTMDELRKSLELLTVDELELIQGLFYRGVSLRKFSQETGIPLNTLKYRKDKVLEKLKVFLEN